MTFEDRVRRLSTGDAKTTTEALVKEYRLNKMAHDELFPVIEDRVRHLLREFTRQQERSPRFTSGTIKRVSLKGPQSAVIEDFRMHTVRMFDGRVLRWGEMTIEDHEARIAHLGKQVSGINRTIERHQWAIDKIKKHKVKTLDEIPGQDLEEVSS